MNAQDVRTNVPLAFTQPRNGMISKLKRSIKRSSISPVAFFFKNFFAAPGNQAAIVGDLLRTRKQMAFLRRADREIDSSKSVLVISLTADVYTMKLEAMLSSGLRLSGWRPRVIISRSSTWAKLYFESFGLRDFIYWEDFEITNEERSRCRTDADTFLKGELNFQGVKEWQYRGAWIGPQILASVSRKNHLGAPNVQDPKIRAEIIDLLPRVLENVIQAQNLVAKVKPRLALVNEANGPDMGPIVDMAIANGTSVVQFTQPSRDDVLVLKRLNSQTRRIHPSSLCRATLDLQKSVPWTERMEAELSEEFSDRYNGKWFLQNRNQQHVKTASVDSVREQLQLDPKKKTAVVFSHVLWDANLFYGNDLFEDYGDWFVQTVRTACKNPHLNWLIKLHPANAWKRARDNATGELAEAVLIREKIGEIPSHVKVIYPTSEISTRTLFDICDYGVTVRGTAGVELPCFGVPTLTAGTGRYSGLGFTVDSNTREEYLDRLMNLQSLPPLTEEQRLLAKRHAYALFRLRPWKMKSFRSVFNYPKQGRHPLDQNLFPQISKFEDLEANGDLEKWAVWAGQLDSIDYLDEFPKD